MDKPNPNKGLPPDWESKMADVEKLWRRRKQEKWRKEVEKVSSILINLIQNAPNPKLCRRPSPSCLQLGAQRFESNQPPNE